MKLLNFIFLSLYIPIILSAQSHQTKTAGNPPSDYSKIEMALGMTDRRIIFSPLINDTSEKTLRVVVSIQVDRLGNITWAKATLKGSTVNDSALFRLAEESALKTKIDADPLAPEQQYGTITYTFRVK